MVKVFDRVKDFSVARFLRLWPKECAYVFFKNGSPLSFIAKNKTVRHNREYSSTNAWNLNLSNGNFNNWNTKASDKNRVRAVSALFKYMITTEDMIEAYYNCRASKRRTASAIEYEMNYESRLIDLRNRINSRTYSPGKSICFIVTRPRYREVFAASFEDRIIHHLIAIRLEPLFEQIFSDRTFNCRKGKGQMYGVEMLRRDIISCSNNFTEDCYILKLDLKGFFMSINKAMLAKLLDDFIVEYYKGDDIEDLRFLTNVVILHCPEKNCERHSPIELWEFLARNKSLFTNGEGLGVAIGNLFAQLFANFLLNKLDWFLILTLGFIFVGRYVDDFYIVDKDKDKLLAAIPKIRELLASLGLTLNPKKFYLQHYSKGVEFTGSVLKMRRVYVCKRTVYNFEQAVDRFNKSKSMKEVVSSILE